MVAQAQIINKILNSKDISLITLNNLESKYFFNYETEYKYILNHYDLYKVVPDKLTFASAFPSFDFVDVNEPDSYLLEQLYSDYNTSYMVSKFNEVRKLITSGESEKALNVFENAYTGLQRGSVMTCTNLITDTSRYDRYVERTTDQTKYYLRTGFPHLDKLIGGIDRQNENLVIIARTGQGKTQLLLKMATEASKQGLTVGIYEGEMSNDKVGYRIDTYLGHIKNTALNRGELFIKNDYKNYIESLKLNNYGDIKVFTQNDVPSGVVTVDTLKTFIERENIDILFVDQYDLMDDKFGAKTEFERIGNIARDIKKLQVEKQIPIIAVSQMNRTKNEDGSQDTTQVAGSDKIPRYATIMLALEQKLKEEGNGVQLKINVLKARDGGDKNVLTYDVNFNTGDFNYIPSSKDGITSEDEAEEIANSYNIDYSDSEDIPF